MQNFVIFTYNVTKSVSLQKLLVTLLEVSTLKGMEMDIKSNFLNLLFQWECPQQNLECWAGGKKKLFMEL